MSLNANTSEIGTWWGRHAVAPNRADLWMLGALDLLIERTESAWVVRSRHVGRPEARAMKRTGLTKADLNTLLGDNRSPSALSPYTMASFQALTLPAKGLSEELLFSPALPEHLFSISLTTNPILLEPGEQATLAVILPLQIRIDFASSTAPTREGCEIPIEPMVETWSSASPLDGELAFTTGRNLVLDTWSGRAGRLDQTGLAVQVRNAQRGSLLVDRIAVPCHQLSLFHSPQTGFWCDTLIVEARDALPGSLTRTNWSHRTERALPKEAGTAQFVSHPRAGATSALAPTSLKGFAQISGSIGNLFREKG